MGRKKSIRNYPRTCDIDIIDFNKLNCTISINHNTLTVPHPRMDTRNFVLLPLFEINNMWLHPKTKTKLCEIISKLPIKNISTIKII